MSTTEMSLPDRTQLHEAIRRLVTRQQYDLWFSSLRVVAPDAGREGAPVRLLVANPFIRDWLSTYYTEVLRNAISECTGESTDWELALGPPEDASDASQTPQPAAPRELRRAPEAVVDNHAFYVGNSDIVLNEKYTFDNFVIGPSNRLAQAAARAVADAPAASYNPLFVHGRVGLGKTHLLQAICHQAMRSGRRQNVLYLASETFVNQFIGAVEHGDLDRFRYRYRNVDLLLVDDIHLLANKERTQEEFFHTFNVLYNAGKQIVLSSDSPAQEIPTLKERLITRFRWGFEAALAAPCYETRLSILRRKARERSAEVPDEVLNLIAEQVDTNIRELEGAITKVIGYSTLIHRPIDLDLASQALNLSPGESVRPVTGMDRVVEVVSRHFGVKLADLQGRRRTQSIALPRQVAMYLARRLTSFSLEEIGVQFGNRDHSTVLYAVDKIRTRCEEDRSFAQLLVELESRTRR